MMMGGSCPHARVLLCNVSPVTCEGYFPWHSPLFSTIITFTHHAVFVASKHTRSCYIGLCLTAYPAPEWARSTQYIAQPNSYIASCLCNRLSRVHIVHVRILVRSLTALSCFSRPLAPSAGVYTANITSIFVHTTDSRAIRVENALAMLAKGTRITKRIAFVQWL
jgi:hypothetical protein